MSERTKKILLILAFIAVILIVGFLIYYLFFRQFLPAVPPTNAPLPPVNGFPSVNVNVNLPITNLNQAPSVNVPPVLPALPPVTGVPGPVISPVANGGLTAINVLQSTKVYSPALATNGKDLVYFDQTDGCLYSLTAATSQIQKFTDQCFANSQDVIWSGNMSKAVIEFPDGGNVLYDFTKKKSYTLPSQWKDFAFSPDSTKIVFKNMMLDPEDRYIATASPDGSDYTEIEALGTQDQDVTITWSPNNEYIALYREGLDATRSTIYPIGLNNENFSSLRVEGRDPHYIWSPSGNSLLYSVFNSASNYNPLLWIVDTDPNNLGTGRRSLALNTWADKCVFANDTIIYCAVPRTMEMGTGFIPSLADGTPDDFYRINLDSGTSVKIAEPIFTTTVQKLFVSSDQSTLYWQEKNTGEIKELNLK